MTLNSYLAAVEAITKAPLKPDDAEWLVDACFSGFPPERFANWISLTASPSIDLPGLPLAPRTEQAPPPGCQMPGGGTN